MNDVSVEIIFKSKGRLLRIFTLAGLALYLLLIAFLFLHPTAPFSRDDLGIVVFAFVVVTLSTAVIAYLIFILLWPSSVLFTTLGIIIKKGWKPPLYIQWTDLKAVIIINMTVSSRGYSYSGYKLLVRTKGKQINSVTSFDIGNFAELIAFLTTEEHRTNIEFHLQKQFKEKAFVARFYAVVLWLVLLLAVSSIFFSSSSRHFIL